jgi:hypothetical protein
MVAGIVAGRAGRRRKTGFSEMEEGGRWVVEAALSFVVLYY